MARVLPRNYDEYTVNALTHGTMSSRTLESLRARSSRATGRMTGRLKELYEESVRELESLDLERVRDRVRSVQERNDRIFSEDLILPVISLDDFRTAKLRNRTTIMYSARARKLYYEGRTAGYHGEFVDNEPGRYGRDHTQWRELMNGSFVNNGDDSAFTTYLSDDLVDYETDDPLDQLGGKL